MDHRPADPPRYVPRDASTPRYGPGYVPREPVQPVEPTYIAPPARRRQPMSQLKIGWICFALFFGFIGAVALYGSTLP